jgi:hypothetical protein
MFFHMDLIHWIVLAGLLYNLLDSLISLNFIGLIICIAIAYAVFRRMKNGYYAASILFLLLSLFSVLSICFINNASLGAFFGEYLFVESLMYLILAFLAYYRHHTRSMHDLGEPPKEAASSK